jgi:hypothetical protein
MSDKLIQLLRGECTLNERDLCNQLGSTWDDIRPELDVLLLNDWVLRLPPYLTDKEGGYRFYITTQGRAEYNRRVIAAKNKRGTIT